MQNLKIFDYEIKFVDGEIHLIFKSDDNLEIDKIVPGTLMNIGIVGENKSLLMFTKNDDNYNFIHVVDNKLKIIECESYEEVLPDLYLLESENIFTLYSAKTSHFLKLSNKMLNYVDGIDGKKKVVFQEKYEFGNARDIVTYTVDAQTLNCESAYSFLQNRKIDTANQSLNNIYYYEIIPYLHYLKDYNEKPRDDVMDAVGLKLALKNDQE